MKIYYEHYLKEKSRELRNNPTQSEKLLWNLLKGKKLKGYSFTRQKPIGKFIVDFYSGKLHLVIEIDGDSHEEKSDEDANRDLFLGSLGIDVLRIDDGKVKSNEADVLKIITEKIHEIENSFGK